MDPFAILRQGTVFNKQRFGADIAAFKVCSVLWRPFATASRLAKLAFPPSHACCSKRGGASALRPLLPRWTFSQRQKSRPSRPTSPRSASGTRSAKFEITMTANATDQAAKKDADESEDSASEPETEAEQQAAVIDTESYLRDHHISVEASTATHAATLHSDARAQMFRHLCCRLTGWAGWACRPSLLVTSPSRPTMRRR